MLNLKRLIPTECLLCKTLDHHPSPNLCLSCQEQLPYLRNCCLRCSLPLPHQEQRCGHCLKHNPVYDGSFCAIKYELPSNRLIIRMKHGKDLTCISTLAAIFSQAYKDRALVPDMTDIDLILPIPLNWSRKLRRGFNQSQSLAYLISRELNIPMADHLLKRIKPTPMQQGLNRSARMKNLKGCFSCSPKFSPQLEGLKVALFDDVITTGATMESATSVLKKAGVQSVFAWSIARTVTV